MPQRSLSLIPHLSWRRKLLLIPAQSLGLIFSGREEKRTDGAAVASASKALVAVAVVAAVMVVGVMSELLKPVQAGRVPVLPVKE